MSAYSGIAADMKGLAQMRSAPVQRQESALEEVAGHFEALFTRMMLKTMRESSIKGDLFESNQTTQYTEMFDDQVAVQMSRGRGLGLKELLIRQLQQVTPADAAPKPDKPAAPTLLPATRQEFIENLIPFARRIENELGISHKAVLAQAALESGWGRHAIRNSDGSSTFNLFGIKADSSWTGDVVARKTLEFEDGVGRHRTERFRSYASLNQAATDYADFIRKNPRYEQAIRHGSDPKTYAYKLQEAGYATDPDYASKIAAILDGPMLQTTGLIGSADLTANRPGVM